VVDQGAKQEIKAGQQGRSIPVGVFHGSCPPSVQVVVGNGVGGVDVVDGGNVVLLI